MPITFPCSSCGKTLKTPDESAGKQGKCPHCGSQMQIPSSASAFSNQPAPSHSDPFSSPTQPSSGASSNSPFNAPLNQLPNIPQAKPLPGANPYAGPAPGPSPYASPGYAPSGGNYQVGAGMGSHHSSLILALGIIGLILSVLGYLGCCCVPLGAVAHLIALCVSISASIMGNTELKKYNQGQYGRQGRSETQAGMICGIIGTVFSGIFLLFSVGYLVWVVFFIAASGAR